MPSRGTLIVDIYHQPGWIFKIVQEMRSWMSTIPERFKWGGKIHPESEPNHSRRGQGTVVAAAFTSAPWPTANTWPRALLCDYASDRMHSLRALFPASCCDNGTFEDNEPVMDIQRREKWQMLILTSVTEGASCPIQNGKLQCWKVKDIPAFPSSLLAFTPRKYFRNDTTNGEDTVWISADFCSFSSAKPK